MFNHHTPFGVRPPFGNYSHGVEVFPGSRWLVCSGQLGIDVHDVIPQSMQAQTRLCFENLAAILASASMNFSHVVRLNAYVTDRAYFSDYMKVRDQFVSTPPPASTLMVVGGFTREEFKIEVEAIAASV